MRKPFKKQLSTIPTENAHGGSGRRQLILSKEDPVSTQLHAMTKGFLKPGAIFDWHEHEGIDEFFLVTQGTGIITFEDGTVFTYNAEDLIYTPANHKHRIENTGTEESHFFFIRVNQ